MMHERPFTHFYKTEKNLPSQTLFQLKIAEIQSKSKSFKLFIIYTFVFNPIYRAFREAAISHAIYGVEK
jgi:hypothetical protein